VPGAAGGAAASSPALALSAATAGGELEGFASLAGCADRECERDASNGDPEKGERRDSASRAQELQSITVSRPFGAGTCMQRRRSARTCKQTRALRDSRAPADEAAPAGVGDSAHVK